MDRVCVYESLTMTPFSRNKTKYSPHGGTGWGMYQGSDKYLLEELSEGTDECKSYHTRVPLSHLQWDFMKEQVAMATGPFAIASHSHSPLWDKICGKRQQSLDLKISEPWGWSLAMWWIRGSSYQSDWLSGASTVITRWWCYTDQRDLWFFWGKGRARGKRNRLGWKEISNTS